VVFPGGKVDATDRDEAWGPSAQGFPRFAADDDEATARAFGIAACREALEEAAILLTAGAPLDGEEVLLLRTQISEGSPAPVTLRSALEARGLSLDLSALQPFGRWVTPIAESRRFDTRFFLAVAPAGQDGAHDAHETTASFWAAPAEVLRRFDAGELQLAPPTHRCLQILAGASSVIEAVVIARHLGVEPVCPKLVPVPDPSGATEGTLALVLPGDHEHEVRTPRVPGPLRFVLRGERWVPEAPPAID